MNTNLDSHDWQFLLYFQYIGICLIEPFSCGLSGVLEALSLYILHRKPQLLFKEIAKGLIPTKMYLNACLLCGLKGKKLR